MTAIVRIGSPRQALILLLPDRGMPVIAGQGAFAADIDLLSLPVLLGRASRINGMDEHPASAVLLPVGGSGAFQWPGLAGHRGGRDFVLAFTGWKSRAEGKATVLTGEDKVAGLHLAIEIAVSDADVMTMRSRVTNLAEGVFHLDRCMAGTMLVAEECSEVLTLDGGWGREFHQARETLGSALWVKENRRGRTSHDRYPAVVLGPRGFGVAGPVSGLHLGWSGNHVIAIDRLDDGRRLVHAGELFEPGEMRLASGETYESPVCFISVTPSLAEMANQFHRHVRSDLLQWPGGSMAPRPVTLNTWEGTYFDHDVSNLKRQAEAAAKLGIERFVLDDGWFGRRDDDTTSLGDWFIDARKYPDGLKPLVDHVVGLGMQFGLWFEPEMVNPVSDLFRAHPDWALQVEGHPLLLSRNQVVLDLGRPEVSQYLFERMDDVLSKHAVSYVKWDMNRDLTTAGGADGRAATSRQTRAFYALVDRIRAAHPSVEIESCSSGGGRADYGALSRTHRVWTSDCTDALERQSIQRGAALFLPPEVMGAHISASPNHQTGRRHTLAFRALTALPYHLGIELSPLDLKAEERRELKAYISLHKRLRGLLHSGFTRHHDLGDGRLMTMISAPDGSRHLVFVAQTTYGLSEQPAPLRLPGLERGLYKIAIPKPQEPNFFRITVAQEALFADGGPIPGQVLGSIGLPLPALRPESAVLIEVTRVKKGR